MAFKMKNKAVMKMAKMAGNNRTAMKLKAEDAAMKMKKQSAMKMAKKDSAMDMGHSPKKMKKNSPMKDNHFEEKLDQVDLVGKRGRKKFYETTKHVGGGNVETFKHKKSGKVVRRDDIGAGMKSGGGFVNRLKKEGLGSAIANIAPARYLRTVKRELGGNIGKAITGKRRKQNPEHLKGKHKLTKTKK